VKKIFSFLVAAIAAFTFSMPASASSQPIALWIIDTNGQLFSVDSATGNATAVGSGTGIVGSAMAGALDPVTGKIVVLNDNCALYTVDVTTGVATDLHLELHDSANTVGMECTTMTIDGAGTGWASVTMPDRTDHLGSFDVATGVVDVRSAALNDYYDAIFFDPTNGKLYGQNDSLSTIFEVDQATGVDTDTTVQTSPYSYNIVMDDAGNYWANSWDTLYKGTAGTWNSGVSVGAYTATSNVNCLFTSTNFWPVVVPPAENGGVNNKGGLADTGAELPPYFAIGALLVLLSVVVARKVWQIKK
jgi:hypothetical protein